MSLRMFNYCYGRYPPCTMGAGASSGGGGLGIGDEAVVARLAAAIAAEPERDFDALLARAKRKAAADAADAAAKVAADDAAKVAADAPLVVEASSDFSWSGLLGPSLLPPGTGADAAGTDGYLGGKRRVALYFGGSWCEPCRQFLPELSKAYSAPRSAQANVEVVYVSSDKDQAAFDSYRAAMPFPALPHSESRDTKTKLSEAHRS